MHYLTNYRKFIYVSFSQGPLQLDGAAEARKAHNLEVLGSNPSRATFFLALVHERVIRSNSRSPLASSFSCPPMLMQKFWEGTGQNAIQQCLRRRDDLPHIHYAA